MISRIHSIRRRSAFQLSSNCSGRRVSSSSFSSGLGSRLLKTTEKDPPVNNQPQRSPSTDPPKRVSIFSKPASSTPPANGFMAKIGDMTGAGAPARPRFSISAALQNQNVRRSAGDMWKPIPGTATKLIPAAEAATGLEGASSIRDFARRAAEQAKSDAQDRGPSIRVLGGKGLFTKEEISDMKENFDPSNKPLSSAAAVMADVLNQPEEDADSDDEAPQVMEPTAGEMRYWKFQVSFFFESVGMEILPLLWHGDLILSGLVDRRRLFFIPDGLLLKSSPVLYSIMKAFSCFCTRQNIQCVFLEQFCYATSASYHVETFKQSTNDAVLALWNSYEISTVFFDTIYDDRWQTSVLPVTGLPLLSAALHRTNRFMF